jgi:hypothetical protein
LVLSVPEKIFRMRLILFPGNGKLCDMNDSIPSATDVRESLAGLTTGQVRAIADKAGVPFTTLWKIKTGETANPGIETVRRFYGPCGLIFDEKQPLPSAARSSAAINNAATPAA